MTRRLYQDDAYATGFESRVTSAGPGREGYEIVLEATLFYPEAGGQPCDTGLIESVAIGRVAEAGGEIVHLAEHEPPFRAGDTVRGTIDWPRRFLNMQQHTGQHILSQAFLKVLDAQTVSSRLGLDHSTIDVGRLNLTWEDLERVERAANAVVYENRAVKVYEARSGEIPGARAKKQPAGDLLRIVEVDGFDVSPCGGTHCRCTGEVGLVKILRWEKVRETTRVEFVCGGLAEADYFWKSRAIVELAQEFTTSDTAIPGMMRDLEGSVRDLHREAAKLRARLADYEIRDLEAAPRMVAGARTIAAVFDAKPPAELREMAARLTAGGGTVALLMSRSDRVHLVFSRSADLAVDMRLVAQAATAILEGRGGGKPEACEGGGKHPERAEDALAAAVEKLASLLAARA